MTEETVAQLLLGYKNIAERSLKAHSLEPAERMGTLLALALEYAKMEARLKEWMED